MQLKAFVSQGNDTAFEKHREAYNNVGNYYASASQMEHYDSLINATESKQDIMLSMSLLNPVYAI